MVSVSHEVPQQPEPIAALKVKSNLIKASKGASGQALTISIIKKKEERFKSS